MKDNLQEAIAKCKIRLKKAPFKVKEKVKHEIENEYFQLEITEIYENTFFKCKGKQTIRSRHHPLDGQTIDFHNWFRYDSLIKIYSETDFKKPVSWEDGLEKTESKKPIDLFFLNFIDGMYDLNPVYQRDLVWTKKQKEELIEAIFMKKDIGVITIIEATTKDMLYEILDGKQRLSTIFSFMMNEFKYKGKTYSEISKADKFAFDGFTISFKSFSMRGRAMNEWEKVELFINLNTKGTRVSDKFIEDLRKKYLEE